MAKAPTVRKAPARRAKAAAPAAAASTVAAATDPPVRKQAVVVVHGIGEQRPLDTLREFVETAFQRDASLTPDDDADPRYSETVDGFKLNRVWIVPDVAAGSNELRRITTTEHFERRRTDFYEYYWADLTNNTPLEMVTAWFRGLLLRSPFRIPNDIRIWWSWLILWVLTILLAIGAILVLYPTAGPFEIWVRDLQAFLRWKANELGMILALLSVVVVTWRAYRTKPARKIRLGLPLALLVLSAAILILAPLPIFIDPRFWAAIFTAAIGAIISGILVPYIGDIVRYVRATPLTVSAREAIRTRGLDLLRKLHDRNEYDRIVLVGHSLGCFVAYDLLQLIWQERGPSPKNGWAMSPELKDALHAVDEHVKAWNPLDESVVPRFEEGPYAAAQAKLREVLAASQPKRWVISDFVTLGSPIAHSAFLTHDDSEAVKQGLKERMLSASPPRPDAPNNSMFYYTDDGNPWPHHAAVFAAVRWTNIFDYASFPAFGDVVSGAIDEQQFGPGVRNQRVEIRRGKFPLWRRRFTHTVYWRLTNGTWAKPDDHVAKLRAALNLIGK